MIKCLELVLVFFMVSILVGSLPIRMMKDKSSGLLKSILYGTILMLVLFEILVIPMTILGQSLTRLTQVWCTIITAISIIAVITSKGYLSKQIKKIPLYLKGFTSMDVIILVLIFIQIFICVKYIFLHQNDAYYVGMTTTTITTDRLYGFSPYTGTVIEWSNYKFHVLASLPVFWAMLAKLFGVTGAFFCHTIAPILFIPVAYILYYELGLLLFKNEKRSVSLFLFMICIINLFIGKKYDSSYEMVSTCIWQGGSFLYNIALPGIFYFQFRFFRKNKKISDLSMLLIMFIVAIMTVPVTGIMLSILMMVVLALSFGIEKAITRRKRMDAGINI